MLEVHNLACRHLHGHNLHRNLRRSDLEGTGWVTSATCMGTIFAATCATAVQRGRVFD